MLISVLVVSNELLFRMIYIMRSRFRRLRDPGWKPDETDPSILEEPSDSHAVLEGGSEEIPNDIQGEEFHIISCIGATEEQLIWFRERLLSGEHPIVTPFQVHLHFFGPGFVDLVTPRA